MRARSAENKTVEDPLCSPDVRGEELEGMATGDDSERCMEIIVSPWTGGRSRQHYQQEC